MGIRFGAIGVVEYDLLPTTSVLQHCSVKKKKKKKSASDNILVRVLSNKYEDKIYITGK